MINRDCILTYLQWLMEKQRCSAATRNQRLACLKTFLKFIADKDFALSPTYMAIDKIPRVRCPKPNIGWIPENALAEILKQPKNTKMGKRDRFFMILLYDTRARLFYTIIKGMLSNISPDNVERFIRNYGKEARKTCSQVPMNLHPHLFRHSRASHLYRAGVPLSVISRFLGHADLNTTDIYASADIEMMKKCLSKVNTQSNCKIKPISKGNDEMIAKLCGLS